MTDEWSGLPRRGAAASFHGQQARVITGEPRVTTFILRRNPRAVHPDAQQSNSREPRRNGPYPSPQHLPYEFRFQDKPRSQAVPKVSLRKPDTFLHDLLLIGKLVSLGTTHGKLLGNLPHTVSNVNAADTNDAPASTNNRTKRKSAPTSAKKLAVDDSCNADENTVVYEDTDANGDNAGKDEDAVYKFECSHRCRPFTFHCVCHYTPSTCGFHYLYIPT